MTEYHEKCSAYKKYHEKYTSPYIRQNSSLPDTRGLLYSRCIETSLPITEKIINAIILTATILAPVGVSSIYDPIIPKVKHPAETAAEVMTAAINLLHTLIAVSAGKIIRLDIKSDPIILIPKTTVTAVITAITVLKNPVLIPAAFAKFSSNVTAKIRL